MIKNIVFDIGNVLADNRLKEFLIDKGFDGATIKRIVKASVMSPYWEQFERCDLTEAEAIKAFASLDPELEEALHKAYDNIAGMLVIRDFAVDWIKSLKAAGLHTYYLSNYSSKAYYECPESIVFMEYMDGGLLSFQARMTKPNPEFYKKFLEEYKLNANECVFIDDTPENVEVANELGFKGIVFDNYENVVEKLKGLV